MPRGKASKQRRRGEHAAPPPPVRPKGGPRRRQASLRVLVAAGAAVLAIAIAVVLAVAVGGRSSSSLKNVPAVGSLANGLPGASEVNTLFKGIPQSGTTLGRSTAPVTLVEFIDPQCPYCRQFETAVLPDLVEKYVRTGRLKIELQPWAFIGSDSIRGQAAILAAAEQNKAFDYTELLYDNQGTENTGWLNDATVAAVARSIPGLHVRVLLKARASGPVEAGQKRVDDLVIADNVTGTPTLFVGRSGTKGTQVDLTSPTDEQAVLAAIGNATH